MLTKTEVKTKVLSKIGPPMGPPDRSGNNVTQKIPTTDDLKTPERQAAPPGQPARPSTSAEQQTPHESQIATGKSLERKQDGAKTDSAAKDSGVSVDGSCQAVPPNASGSNNDHAEVSALSKAVPPVQQQPPAPPGENEKPRCQPSTSLPEVLASPQNSETSAFPEDNRHELQIPQSKNVEIPLTRSLRHFLHGHIKNVLPNVKAQEVKMEEEHVKKLEKFSFFLAGSVERQKNVFKEELPPNLHLYFVQIDESAIRLSKNNSVTYICVSGWAENADITNFHTVMSDSYHFLYDPWKLCYERVLLIQPAVHPEELYQITLQSDADENTLCGALLQTKLPEEHWVSTIGGLIEVDDKRYALTTAHRPEREDSSDSNEPASSAASPSQTLAEENLLDKVEPVLVFTSGKNSTRGDHSPGFKGEPISQLRNVLAWPEYPINPLLKVHEGSDWRLIPIKRELQFPNYATVEYGGNIDSVRNYLRTSKSPSGLKANVKAGVSGFRSGVMSLNPSFLVSKGASLQKVWTLNLDNDCDLKKGDSGSWVMFHSDDTSELTVIGSVVAMSPGKALVVLLQTQFKQIEEALGAKRVQLASPVMALLDLAQQHFALAERYTSEAKSVGALPYDEHEALYHNLGVLIQAPSPSFDEMKPILFRHGSHLGEVLEDFNTWLPQHKHELNPSQIMTYKTLAKKFQELKQYNPKASPYEISIVEDMPDRPPEGSSTTSVPNYQTQVKLHERSETSPPKGSSLFDDSVWNGDVKTEAKLSYAKAFFQLMDSFHERYIKSMKQKRRIKVAILDTGLDRENSMILDTRKRRMSSTNDREDKGEAGNSNHDPIVQTISFTAKPVLDTYGHGTQIASLLMRIAPSAEIFVAKIFDGGSVESADNVVKATQWAQQRGVDIIVMSFGFDGKVTEIENAISEAERSGIIIFAAASNHAGNPSISFPAQLENVIRIYAADGEGIPDPMNPTYQGETENFSTLGVAIQSSWKGTDVFKSGTSFATAIAAGIAANVLAYIDGQAEKGNLIPTLRNFAHTRKGMSKIFSAMSADQFHYNYVTPWQKWWRDGAADQDICSQIEGAML